MSIEEDNRKIMNSLKAQYPNKGVGLGMKQGIKQVSKIKSLEIVKSLLKEDIGINSVAKCTRLSLEELEKIKF